MNRKATAMIVIMNFCLTVVFCPPIAWGEHMVNPSAGLSRIINEFEEDQAETSELKIELANQELKLLDAKRSGTTMWGSEKWMKDSNYYKSLSTVPLAKECFSQGIFWAEMMLFDNSEFAFQRLKIMHNGYSELFKRKDMWKGILAVYEMLYSKIDPKSELKEIVEASRGLDSFQKLYGFPQFKKQIKGREEVFLNANLNALKRFRWYIEEYDPEKIGTNMPFYCAPCSVADVALMLMKQVNYRKYAEIIPEIIDIRWSQEQKIGDVKSFFDQVITALEESLPDK